MKTLNFFTYDGVNALEELGVFVQKKDVYSAAAPKITKQSVPGRNGDLLIDEGGYKNAKISYTCAFVKENFAAAARNMRAAIASRGRSYRKLEDTYDPEYFRLAAILEEIKITQKGTADGTIAVDFDCKPFRYSNEGQTERALTKGGTVQNPEAFSSEPYFRIVGSGAVSLTVNGEAFAISNVDGYIELDAEMQDAHKGDVNENAKVNFLAFPSLAPGANIITWTGDASVYLMPRWRTL